MDPSLPLWIISNLLRNYFMFVISVYRMQLFRKCFSKVPNAANEQFSDSTPKHNIYTLDLNSQMIFKELHAELQTSAAICSRLTLDQNVFHHKSDKRNCDVFVLLIYQWFDQKQKYKFRNSFKVWILHNLTHG